MPRSPRLLVIAGLIGLLFFWVTDPKFGLAAPLIGDRARDAANQALPGTAIGVIGSAVVLLIGSWLALRRHP